jgi:hypothetical protein
VCFQMQCANLFVSSSLISVKPIEKYLAFESRSGTKSQLYSQGKLTTLSCENRKIQHETKKQTNGSTRCRDLDILNGIKKQKYKSRDIEKFKD